MKRILVLFVFFGYFLLTYSLEYHEQVYYVAHGTLDRDTIRCVSFDVVNSNMEPIVILFTEDDLEKMNFEEVLNRKCYRRYGDFSLSCWAYDNVINCGEPYSFVFPQAFIKIVYPMKRFKFTIISSNIPFEKIKSCVSRHMIVCKELDINKYISSFITSVEENKVTCMYDSLVVEWECMRVLEE